MPQEIPTTVEFKRILDQKLEKFYEKKLSHLEADKFHKPWLTTEELMDLTGWSRRTFQYLRDQRKIPFSQLGRKILYPRDGVEEFLRENLIEKRTPEEY